MMIQSDEYFSEGLKPPTSFNRTHLWWFRGYDVDLHTTLVLFQDVIIIHWD